MPSLTSCYFCGEAVGASLDEYDLPEDAPDDDQVTVTLCAGCKEKLSALFEEIDPAGGSGADAAAGTSSTVDPAADADAEPDVSVEPTIDEDPDLDPVAGEQEPIFADDGDAVLDEELPGEAAERPFATADEEAETAADSGKSATDADSDVPSPDRDEGRIDEPGSTDPGPDVEGPGVKGSDAEGTDGPEMDDPTDGADAASAPTNESDAPSAALDESDADTGRRSGDADRDAPAVEVNAGAGGSSSSTAAAESSGGSTDGPLADVSPRTYNRVVRLLQNREFPVDRADFEALATSAYELDHGECAAALDGAIEKGLLEERDGMLHRPE